MEYTRELVDSLVAQILEAGKGISDIVMTAGKGIQAEIDGQLRIIKTDPDFGMLKPADTKGIALALMAGNKRLQQLLANRGSCDFSHAVHSIGRFRVNIFKQRGTLAVIMRRLPTSVPTFGSLGLPDIFTELAQEKYGLILVTGGTGQGKSNSLAALVNQINQDRAVHIITLEDPIEFVHKHQQGTVNQRELGIDFDTFASGLKSAFRQAPKVILLGEIRDKETMEIALQAAGTGHLVLSTLHTTDTGQTITRILSFFDNKEERLIRMKLAECLRYVVAQRLMPKESGGMVPAFEVMKNTLRIRELILGGETPLRTFYQVLSEGKAHGMNTFDQSLLELYEQRIISEETATLSASDRGQLIRMIDHVKLGLGIDDSNEHFDGLEMDEEVVFNEF